MMKLFFVINVVFFQASWLLAAFFQDYAALLILVLLIIHFLMSPTRRLDSKILLMGLLGIVVDQCLISVDVFAVGQSIIPSWLVMLWLYFSLCLNHSLGWLRNLRYWQVALLGSVLGTLSYVAALNLDVITTTLTQQQFVMIEILVWFVLLPIMVKFANVVQDQEEACNG